MARKTSKVYRIEYQDLLEKTKTLESHIRNRLKQICKNNPNAIIGDTNNNKPALAKDYPERLIMSASIFTILALIEKIEKYNEKQSGHVQTSMYEDELSQNDLMKAEPKEFIEYEDVNDDYEFPERKEVAEILPIRLYCFHDGCNKYIKGNEGYNGMFTAETGQRCDLRNQGFKCKEHGEE